MFTSEEMKAFSENLGAGKQTLGSRKGRIKDLLLDMLFVPSLLLLWVTTAPQRFMSHWLLGMSRLLVPGAKATLFPPVCDLVNLEWSPVTVCQQFFSRIITAGSEWQLTSGRPQVIRPRGGNQCRHL